MTIFVKIWMFNVCGVPYIRNSPIHTKERLKYYLKKKNRKEKEAEKNVNSIWVYSERRNAYIFVFVYLTIRRSLRISWVYKIYCSHIGIIDKMWKARLSCVYFIEHIRIRRTMCRKKRRKRRERNMKGGWRPFMFYL